MKKDTKQIILDAAEELFAKKGFHGASMRNITASAGANLSSVNYHFGSKEALLEAVFERRLLPLNQERSRRLDAVSAEARNQGRRPVVREVVMAFIEPTLRFRESGEGARNFISLVGRSLAGQDVTMRRIFLKHVAPIIMKFFTVLRESVPETQEKMLIWKLHFALGALFHVMHLCSETIHEEFSDVIPGEAGEQERGMLKALLCSKTDTETLIEMLTSFIARGMEEA